MRGTRRQAALATVLASICLAVVAATAASQAALVQVGSLVLRADGSFRPSKLPQRGFAPIELDVHIDLRSTAGGPPPPLDRMVLEFDRNGRLSTDGLPTCRAAGIAGATVAAARRKCKGAIVGTGQVEAFVLIEGRWLRVLAPLTLFNGPSASAAATVVAHAQPLSLPGEIYVVVVPIERMRGPYGYRATVEVPQIFNGTGTLTRADMTIGRRFGKDGRRSYVSARCSDGSLAAHGTFTFSEGTVIDGGVEKPCTPLP